MSKFLKPALLIVLIWLPMLEVASCVGLKALGRSFVYTPAAIDETEYQEYLAARNPVLGWPATAASRTDPFDAIGARISPAFPNSQASPCVSTFGDSFTYGDQVGSEHAYPNRLATRLRCRVNNFGIGGYGTDQALIAFRERQDSAGVVVLGHYSDNIVRNLNRLRNFVGGAVGLGFKPRFLLEGGALRQLDIPTLPSAEAVRTLREHPELLEHDYFLPGREGGTLQAGFPNLLELARVPRQWRIAARIEGVVSYAPFYRLDHPAQAAQLTTAIMKRFHELAIQRGQRPVILLLPDERDLDAALEGKALPYQTLLDELAQADIPAPDVAGAMLEALKERDVCDLYIACKQHYTPEGYDLVAQVVSDWILDHGLLQPPPNIAGRTREPAAIE